jgi:hypothetical protein
MIVADAKATKNSDSNVSKPARLRFLDAIWHPV